MPFRPAAILFLACALALPANAARLEVTGTGMQDPAGFLAGHCSLTLTGPIEAGDAARLESLLEREEMERFIPTGLDFGTGARAHTLCLDSPGGDDAEALALAEILISQGLVSVVPEGAACIGACAVTFMAGSVRSGNSDGGARMPMRVLHLGARLGFHAPDFAGGSSDEALDYLARFSAGFDGIDSFAPTARFHPQLLVEMLARRDAEAALVIATTGSAGLYDIRLAGVPEIATDEAAWMRACNNLSLQARGWQAPEEPDLSSWSWHVISPGKGYQAEARLPPPETGLDAVAHLPFREVLSRHHQCLFYENGGASPAYSAWFERVSEDSFPRLRLFDLWQTLPHYTPLAALHGMERVEPGDFRTLYADPPVIGDHPDFPALTRIVPGQSLVMRPKDGAGAEFAIWFDPAGEAHLYMPGETAIIGRYRLDGDEVCLALPEGILSCDRIRDGADGGKELTVYGKPVILRFMRAGDIGPLPSGG